MPKDGSGNKSNLVLAFDFGTKKIGVAVGQRITSSATPLTELKARDGIPDWSEIGQLVKQWQPDAFVVGIPLNMDGTPSDITQRARKFCARLHGRFHLPSFGMDERLTSVEAAERLAGDKSALSNVGSLDSMAAKLILESWFREHPNL